jgi:hypothetical protein
MDKKRLPREENNFVLLPSTAFFITLKVIKYSDGELLHQNILYLAPAPKGTYALAVKIPFYNRILLPYQVVNFQIGFL